MARHGLPRLSIPFLLVCLCLLAAPAAPAQFPGLDKLKKMAETQREWSLAEEKAIGQATAAKMVAIFGLYENATMVRYVNLVGGSVSQFAGRRDLDYYFGILDTEIINAFATPGGYIFVTRGLLANLENEAELAGVLAHETIHTSERHLEKELRSRKMAALGWEEGTRQIPVAELAELADRAADTLLAGKLSRDKEREADSQGLELVAAAGYDPSAYPEFLQWLGEGSENDENRRFLGILTASHPQYSDRVNRLEKQIKKSGWDQQEWPRLAGRFEENVDFSAPPPAPAEEVKLAGMEAPASVEDMEPDVAAMEAAAAAAAVSADVAATEAPAVTEVRHEPAGEAVTSGVMTGSGSGAGAILEMEEREPGSNAQRVQATMYMQSDKLRVETKTAEGEDATMIFDQARQVLWMIEPARGRYYEFAAADVRRIEQQMKEVEKALAQVPAEQREMVKKMMAQRMGEPLEIDVRVTGREQVGSYTCTVYEVLVNGQRDQDVWAAPFHQVGLNESDFRVFRAMGEFFEPLRRFAPQAGWDVKGSEEMDGFPVRWVDYEAARAVSEGKVVRAERQDLAAELFNLPAGLKKVELGLR